MPGRVGFQRTLHYVNDADSADAHIKRYELCNNFAEASRLPEAQHPAAARAGVAAVFVGDSAVDHYQ
jgi:hypothetical protein